MYVMRIKLTRILENSEDNKMGKKYKLCRLQKIDTILSKYKTGRVEKD